MSDSLASQHLAHLKEHIDAPLSTIRARASVLRQLNEWLRLGLAYAETDQIISWHTHLRDKGRTPATRCAYGWHISEFYRWACDLPACCGPDHALLDGNPAIGAADIWPSQPQGRPRPILEDELARLLELPDPVWTVVVLGAFEGLRRAEIVAADREHLGPQWLEIPRRKGGRAGSVPTHPQVWAWLCDRPPGPLVRGVRGRRLALSTVTQYWQEAVAALGLPRRLVPHMLRHRYGTQVHAETGDLLVTRDSLGHKSARSTEGYALVASAKVAAAVAALPVPRAAAEASPSRGLDGSDSPAA